MSDLSKLERKRKKAARVEIGNLIEKHCKSCIIYPANIKRHGQAKAQDLCITDCEIGKKLSALGSHLLTKQPQKESKVMVETKEADSDMADELIREKYIELSDTLPDYKIANQFNISVQTLIKRKKKWGIQDRRRNPAKAAPAGKLSESTNPPTATKQVTQTEGKESVNTRKATQDELHRHGVKTILDQTEWFLDSKLPTVPSISLNKQGIWFNAAATKEMGLAEGELLQVGIAKDQKHMVFQKGSMGLKLKLATSRDALQITNKRLAAWLDEKRIKNKQYVLEQDQLTGVWVSKLEIIET